MRRSLDILFAVLCLIISSPLILFIAVLIKAGSAGPVLYKPSMVGQNGINFQLLRFRTMFVDVSHLSTEQRLTRTGRFIRSYSLDHLPMLINLLSGDMTLIGPRPMELSVVDMQDPIWQQYFKSKPGLFNHAVLKLGRMWTPSRTSDPALNQDLELAYQQGRSTASDIQLFFKSLWRLIISRWNIKARGETDPDVERKMSGHMH